MQTLAILMVLALTYAPTTQAMEDIESTISPIVEKAMILAKNHASLPKSTPIPIIAITGGSAVGKSYFAAQLQKILENRGVRATILRADDFMQTAIVENYLTHPHFDYKYLHEVLQALSNRKQQVKKPVWHHSETHNYREDIIQSYENVDLILFEGIYSCCDKDTYDFAQYSALKIFIDAEEKDIIAWNWQRELSWGKKARNKEKFDTDIAWDIEDYKKTVLPAKKNAHFILHRKIDHRYILENGNASFFPLSDTAIQAFLSGMYLATATLGKKI